MYCKFSYFHCLVREASETMKSSGQSSRGEGESTFSNSILQISDFWFKRGMKWFNLSLMKFIECNENSQYKELKPPKIKSFFFDDKLLILREILGGKSIWIISRLQRFYNFDGFLKKYLLYTLIKYASNKTVR